jgi:DNA primase
MEAVCQWFQQQLHGTAGVGARDYLAGRGLEPATVDGFRLGYAPQRRGALKLAMNAKGLDDRVLSEAGLIKPSEDEQGPRDYFFDRIIFPITDRRGRVVAFGGRTLGQSKAKYINSPETPLFHKGRMLYNLAAARRAAHDTGELLVVEGYMDVIALSQAGFAETVAPLGTALTEDQLALLWRVSPEPILAFDGDEAGLRAAKRASRLALPHLVPGQSLRFVFLPKGEDPDSLLRAQGAPAMRALLEKAQPLSDVLWTAETEGHDFSTPERRAGLEAELDRIVQTIRDAKIADYYRRDFNERVFKAFKQRKPASPWSGPAKRRQANPAYDRSGGRFRGQPPPPQDNVSAAVKRSLHVVNALSAAKNLNERRLLGLLVCAPHLIERYSEALAWLSLDDPQLDRLKTELLNLAASGRRLEKTAVENHLVRQGLGVLAERLTTHSVLQADLREADEQAREVLWQRTKAQLADPDNGGSGELKARRDEALQRYLDRGSNEDWDELQRLNALLRNAREH